MEITILLIILIAYFVIKPLIINDLNVEKARKMIDEGAVIIDVRSENEYQTSHLDSTVNIPLPELKDKIGKTVADKGKVVLLHCRSGSRSFAGKRILKSMGYENVFNLGSFKRAKRMIS
ncbi:MAG: rhodanese-like domain-containing protein [Thermodesulfovibrionia bacterium]|nr:rhodanese-like domain-containing protein [Thermodesulfovibrionia bacterium]